MQLALLFNLIAQNNQVTSIDIATSSRQVAFESKLDQKISIEIADTSRTIAAESKRESTAMKTVAAVTTVFLPGTFAASLFSTPLFHWDKQFRVWGGFTDLDLLGYHDTGDIPHNRDVVAVATRTECSVPSTTRKKYRDLW